MIRAALTWAALLAAGVPFGGTAHRLSEEGNAHYRAGDLEEALRAYTEAQVARPDAPELLYDIGNVLYRKEDWASAEEAYGRAVTSPDAALSSRAAFNLGNALFRQERFEEAADAYRRALERTPDDKDAKRNLELALQRAQQQAQQRPQPQQQQQPQDGESGSQEPERRDGSPPPDREPQPSEDDGGGNRESGEDRGPEDRPPAPQGGAGEQGRERTAPAGMSRAEAERLLDGLEGQERENLRRLAEKAARADDVRREKDW